MNLDLSERLMLLNLLPAEGNIVTLRIMQELRAELGFSEEELKLANFVQDGQQTRWDPKVDLSKDVTIGDAACGLIADVLKKLNDESKLTANHLSLYKQFVDCKEKA